MTYVTEIQFTGPRGSIRWLGTERTRNKMKGVNGDVNKLIHETLHDPFNASPDWLQDADIAGQWLVHAAVSHRVVDQSLVLYAGGVQVGVAVPRPLIGWVTSQAVFDNIEAPKHGDETRAAASFRGSAAHFQDTSRGLNHIYRRQH